MTKFIAPILAALGALVGLPEESQDLAAWAASTAALAGVVGLFVAYVRANLLPALHGAQVVAVSFITSIALALGLGFAGYLDGAILQWLGFGAVAGFTASGGVDLIKGVLGGKSSAA